MAFESSDWIGMDTKRKENVNKYIVYFRDEEGREEFQSYFQADDYGHAEEQAKDYSDCPIVEIKLDTRQYWLHKFSVEMAYGGPEEGGWNYDTGVPTGDSEGPFNDEESAFERCRELNEIEHAESEKQDYSYSSVLSYKSDHFEWDVSEDETAHPYPEVRPHYE